MTTQTFDAFGGKLTVNYDGSLVSSNDQSSLYKYVDIDLRADAAADPTKLSTLVFIVLPCDAQSGMCSWGTVVAPASVLIRFVQETMQAQLEVTFPQTDVPRNGVYDCKTSAYMVLVHQLLKSAGTGDVAGWPLDALELREILGRSDSLIGVIDQVVQAQAPGMNVSGINVVLPDDYKTIKFHRAEVPQGCAGGAVTKTRWGLIAAVGIGVAGIIGATYAIAQRKTSKGK